MTSLLLYLLLAIGWLVPLRREVVRVRWRQTVDRWSKELDGLADRIRTMSTDEFLDVMLGQPMTCAAGEIVYDVTPIADAGRRGAAAGQQIRRYVVGVDPALGVAPPMPWATPMQDLTDAAAEMRRRWREQLVYGPVEVMWSGEPRTRPPEQSDVDAAPGMTLDELLGDIDHLIGDTHDR